MPQIVRQAAFKRTANPTDGIIIRLPSGQELRLTQNSLEHFSESQLQLIARFITGHDDLWLHRNRDETFALAVGDDPPAVWPEDFSGV